MTTFLAKHLIEDNINVPTLPSVVARINALLDDPEIGVREIGYAVAEDAPTAARVLKIANSALFGLRERVLTTEHATAVLGVRMLRTVALQASVMSQFEHLKSSPDFDLEALWKHSILTGHVSSALVKRSRAKIGMTPDEAQVVGLLHDIGQILMLEGQPDLFLAAMRAARAGEGPAHECEQRTMGFNHAHVGAIVAAHWGLPTPVSDAIQYHHGPREALERDPIPALIACANLLVHEVERQDCTAAATVLDARAHALLGLDTEDVANVIDFAARMLTLIEV